MMRNMLQGKLHTPEEYAECIMNIHEDDDRQRRRARHARYGL